MRRNKCNEINRLINSLSSQETDFRSTIHGIGDIPPGDGQVNAEGLFTIDKEPELLDHTVQSGNERSVPQSIIAEVSLKMVRNNPF